MKKIALALIVLNSLSIANERKFSYTYETATMPKGELELESWNTLRFGKDQFYSALDQRLELEWGITDHAQASIYINSTSERTPARDADGKLIRDGNYYQLQDKHSLQGMSFEFKHQLFNAALDGIGFAYYAELGLQAKETEIEGKLLFDKTFGKFTTALNLEGEVELEPEAEPEGNEMKTEIEAEAYKWAADLGVSYSTGLRSGIGIESRIHNVSEGDLSETALFAGPTVHFGGERWWGALSALPQIGEKTDFHEKFEARLLFGFHL